MKAIWYNSVGDVYGELSDDDGNVLERIPVEWDVLMPGDTIRFFNDDEE